MTAPHPMQRIFIDMVKELEDEIHKHMDSEESRMAITHELKNHLARANYLSLPAYQAEIHIALAIQHYYMGKSAKEMAHYEKAMFYATEAGDQLLEIRVRNNIAAAYGVSGMLSEAYDIYQSIAEIHTTGAVPTIDKLYPALNLMYEELRRGDWEAAQHTAERFDALLASAVITANERHNYGRVICYFRYQEAFLYLALGEFERAEVATHLCKELQSQLNTPNIDLETMRLEMFYRLIVNSKVAEFDAWYASRAKINKHTLGDFTIFACILHRHGHQERATQIVQDVLRMAPTDTAENNLRAYLIAFGIQNL